MKKVLRTQLPLFLIFIVSFSFWSFQKNDPLTQKILDYFSNLQSEFPVEKVHLHLDKKAYTLGEDIWFSAYVTAGGVQVPSPLSKTLYVDLFDGEGKLVMQKKVFIEDGFGNGDFKLPDFGNEGVYSIKAYTAWMENFGAEYFYHQNIEIYDGSNAVFFPSLTFEEKIVSGEQVKYSVKLDVLDLKENPLAGETILMKVFAEGEQLSEKEVILNAQGQVSYSFNLPFRPFSSQWVELAYLENGEYEVSKKIKIPYVFQLADIQFFPEGGHLVSGYKSNIAFKGIYPDGSPVDIEGEVIGLAEPTKFKSFFGGMGLFELTPESGVNYQVKVFDQEPNDSKTIDLPKVEDKGLVVTVINKLELAYITVFVQGNYQDEGLTIVSHTRGMINYMVNGELTNGIWGVRIPKGNILSGINHITILNESGIPLLERLVFHDADNTTIDLGITKKPTLSNKSLVELEVISMMENVPMSGEFSVSITDLDQVSSNQDLDNTIISNLLLTSDLKGSVYQPSYYFKDKKEETLQALDLVMMTNGWRRLHWQDVVSEKFPKADRLIERGISIEGVVKEKTKSKKGLRGGEVTAMIGDGEEIISTPFTENGKFLLPNIEFFEDKEMTITAKDERVREYVDIEILQQDKYFDKIEAKAFSKLNAPKNLLESFAARQMMNRLFEEEMMIELEGVEIEAKTMEEETLEQRRTYGQGDVVIKPDNILGSDAFTNIFQMIQGRVAGVQVSISGTSATVLIRGVGTINAGTEPLFLLDNMPVDASILMQVNPRDVAAIDVFKDPASTSIFGSQGSNGAIAVYTKTGDGILGVSVGNLVSKVSGYSVAKEFYHPNYETKTVENSISDKRSTIYWNPRFSIGESGKAEIKYYNSDVATKHLVVIEGMDKQGRLARFETIL
ncbi:TonB-dependent receptor plug domain-containing protein [Belliella sp. R4-6]|uniref:TonB-dependent receptor plug domain-containing protein n=1 Tax=Belliella alkalica TaxID=1730871 RepID=A0ABS9VAH0_9BACT|nr:TonB-dependent receptor plug domain-containing protein [Belliella alkalica]MCH7413433.1 TonB-dependent receptor plug domain-containing protein [Belliella alkalica]